MDTRSRHTPARGRGARQISEEVRLAPRRELAEWSALLTRRLQHRVAEERRLRCSWTLPERAPYARSSNGAEQRRDHAARKRPVGGQGEMELRARTRLERKYADERSIFVEQAAA